VMLSSPSLACLFTSFFWGLFSGNKELLIIGFFLHLSQLCFFVIFFLDYFHCEWWVNIAKQVLSTFTCVVSETFQILIKNGVLIIFLTILNYMCAYDHRHMTVTYIPLHDATIQQWLGCLTHNIFYLCFLNLLLL
jgi:hypothetical protein